MDTYFWVFVATFCALALFVEASRIVVGLFISRQPLSRYLFVLLPLAVSVGSFIVTLNVLNRLGAIYATFPIGIHISPPFYHAIMARFSELSSACQHQIVITLIALALTIFLERDLLPSDTALLTVGRARDRFLADQLMLSRRYM